jgi:hypothetical protein
MNTEDKSNLWFAGEQEDFKQCFCLPVSPRTEGSTAPLRLIIFILSFRVMKNPGASLGIFVG